MIAEILIDRVIARDQSHWAAIDSVVPIVGRLMGAGDYLRDGGHFPWQSAVIMLGFSCLFLVVTVRWIDHHDF